MSTWPERSIGRLDRVVPALLRVYGTPGAAIGVTHRDGPVAVRTFGFADLATKAPVGPETLFEIGSIGKSFTAAALVRVAEEGRVDLNAPVTEVLRWFEVGSPRGSITLHHLLTHTAGIVEGPDISSDSRFDVWALRDLEVGFPPGERFHYSNVGYKALGFALEETEGRPYAEIIRDRVLEPCGMAATEPVIANAMRGRLAVGYAPFPDDRPVRYDEPLAPATWLETATGDGSQASTAEDMASYVRMWLNRGTGNHGRVVSEGGFDLMTVGSAVDAGDDRYGYGLRTVELEGRILMGHQGDMVGYASSMEWEPDSGFGVVVLVNGPDWEGWPMRLGRQVLGWLRAESRGEPLPDLPPTPDPSRVPNAPEYAGVYRSRDGGLLEVTADGQRVGAMLDGVATATRRRWDDGFLVEHPDLERFLLQFERGPDGPIVAAHHGPHRWHRHEPSGNTVAREEDLSAFTGHYRSHNPWNGNFRVVQREGRLVWIHALGWEDQLVPLGPTRFRLGEDEHAPDRMEFDAIVDGKALRATLSGCAYYRTFTP